METDRYSVWHGNTKLADNMELWDALIFVEALFMKFSKDPIGQYTIEKGSGVPVKLSDSNQEPSEWQKGYDEGWSDGYDNGLIDAKESIDSMKIHSKGGD